MKPRKLFGASLIASLSLFSVTTYAAPPACNYGSDLFWNVLPPARVSTSGSLSMDVTVELPASDYVIISGSEISPDYWPNWGFYLNGSSSETEGELILPDPCTGTLGGNEYCDNPFYLGTAGLFPTGRYTVQVSTPSTAAVPSCIQTTTIIQDPPTAVFENVGWQQVAVSIDFSGGGAIDPNAVNSSLSFTWDFGDGTQITNGSASVSHTYSSLGTYTVTLKTYDGEFNSSTISYPITLVSYNAAAVVVPAAMAAGL